MAPSEWAREDSLRRDEICSESSRTTNWPEKIWKNGIQR